MNKEIHELDEGLDVDFDLDSLEPTIMKIPYWKTPDHDDIHVFCFIIFTSIFEICYQEKINFCLRQR